MTRLLRWGSDLERYAVVAGKTDGDAALLLPSADYSTLSQPIELEVVPSRKPKPLGDFPSNGLYQPMILSLRAVAGLREFLTGRGRFADARLGSEPMTLFIPTVVLDLLDREQSTVRVSSSGYQRVQRPVFKGEDALDPRAVFVLKGFERQDVWVTNEFAAEVARLGLVGAEFVRDQQV